MKRTSLPCLFVVSVLSMAFSHGAPPPEPPPEGEWTIEDPVKAEDGIPPLLYLANIACTGFAPEGQLPFVVDVKKVIGGQAQRGIIQSVNGTSNNGSWGATLIEPAGGWTPDNVAVDAVVTLYDQGLIEDHVAIEIQ